MQEQHTPDSSDDGKPELDYRKEDISNTKLIFYIGGGFVLFTLLLVLMIFAFSGKTEKKIASGNEIADQNKSLQIMEDSVLTSYQLIDSVNRIYRIPIDSALAILLTETSDPNFDPTKKSPFKTKPVK